MEDQTADLVKVINESLQLARVCERLIAAHATLTPLIDSINAVVELDNELAPEMLAALGFAGELSDSLMRGIAFAQARFEVLIEQTKEKFGDGT
jgi:hypothetical protein